jgi:serine/threonine protein kinase
MARKPRGLSSDDLESAATQIRGSSGPLSSSAVRPTSTHGPGQVTFPEYVDAVKRSGLVHKEAVQSAIEALARVKSTASERVWINRLGQLLIKRGLLTPWHHQRLLAGQTRGFFLAKYKLLGHLGTGGMSSVYLAVHTRMHRRVAIKVLPPERARDSSYLGRFYIEGRAIAALDHPNIVRAFDIDNQGELHYLVMEYVPGRDLHTCVHKDGPMTVKDAADCIRQAALGLRYAHRRGLVHRDVKPANLLMDQTNCVKLLDLGLARLKSLSQSLTLLHQENVLGTADYLAPEQAVDSHGADHRADIYSLGCTFYYLLVGHPPFPKGNVSQRLLAHQRDIAPCLMRLRSEVPPEIADLVARMMAKRPEDRPQTAHDVASFLEEWLINQGAPKTIRLTGSARKDADEQDLTFQVGEAFLEPPSDARGVSVDDGAISSIFRAVARESARDVPQAVPLPPPVRTKIDSQGTWSNRSRDEETVCMDRPPIWAAPDEPMGQPNTNTLLNDAPNVTFDEAETDWLLEQAAIRGPDSTVTHVWQSQRRDRRGWLVVSLVLTATLALGLGMYLGARMADKPSGGEMPPAIVPASAPVIVPASAPVMAPLPPVEAD